MCVVVLCRQSRWLFFMRPVAGCWKNGPKKTRFALPYPQHCRAQEVAPHGTGLMYVNIYFILHLLTTCTCTRMYRCTVYFPLCNVGACLICFIPTHHCTVTPVYKHVQECSFLIPLGSFADVYVHVHTYMNLQIGACTMYIEDLLSKSIFLVSIH